MTSVSWLVLRGMLRGREGYCWEGEETHSECGAVGDADGEVREYGKEPVGERRAEGKVVGDFVDGEEEVLVGGRADDVGCEQEWPGEDGGRAEEVGAGYLERDDCEDDVFGQWLGTAELGDL